MKSCVIFNPTARGEKALRFRKHLSELSAQCVLRPTTGPGDATQLAEAAVREGFETIIAAGGDGTLNEVVNGIAAAPEGLSRARLGLLPLGTVNVFALELAIPFRITDAWRILQQGNETSIDLGVAAWGEPGREQKRFFAQMAGAGWDARAIDLVSWALKKKYGKMAYVLAGLKALQGVQAPITVSAGNRTGTGPLVLLGNGRFYGGPHSVFPAADLKDGLLEVTLFPRFSPIALARGVLGIFARRPYSLGGAIHFQAPEVTLKCSTRMPFHVEGENTGCLPARFSLISRALRVVIPPPA